AEDEYRAGERTDSRRQAESSTRGQTRLLQPAANGLEPAQCAPDYRALPGVGQADGKLRGRGGCAEGGPARDPGAPGEDRAIRVNLPRSAGLGKRATEPVSRP